VDALVDVPVPSHWSNDEGLNQLHAALQGFPDVRKIVRCTRCVQLQFAFMHMDVTLLNPMVEPRPERVGEIFHSPDTGASRRVPSNPYGFSLWFRKNVTYPTPEFLEAVKSRRQTMAIDRLPPMMARDKALQEKLPPIIPPRVDAQQVHALKLMKRYLNLRYERRRIRRPPSIYFTKLAVTCGWRRRRSIFRTTSCGVGQRSRCGRELRSRSPARPSARYRATHLRMVRGQTPTADQPQSEPQFHKIGRKAARKELDDLAASAEALIGRFETLSETAIHALADPELRVGAKDWIARPSEIHWTRSRQGRCGQTCQYREPNSNPASARCAA
jgi:hypothetical protein